MTAEIRATTQLVVPDLPAVVGSIQLRVVGVSLMGNVVPYGGSATAAAANIATYCNGVKGYEVVADNGVLTITAPVGSGATPNGVAALLVMNVSFVSPFAGGVPAS